MPWRPISATASASAGPARPAIIAFDDPAGACTMPCLCISSPTQQKQQRCSASLSAKVANFNSCCCTCLCSRDSSNGIARTRGTTPRDAMSSARQEALVPRSPPQCRDLCGRRRLQLELSALSGEADLLREELQSLEEAGPLHRCCKDVAEFVGSNAEPFAHTSTRINVCHRAWRWIRMKLCCCFSAHCCSNCCCKGNAHQNCSWCWCKTDLEPKCTCCIPFVPLSCEQSCSICCKCVLVNTKANCCRCHNCGSSCSSCFSCPPSRNGCSCCPQQCARLGNIKDCSC